ncbi:ATP phosphoribosyltransferase regulatory subunit [Prochlorococcus marinus]|uniref:ATP phosphoribosyltransferase regulatory subunit n=1 Tax=Prochlorococcus marinus TaxID=1219 RepID=UPI0022B41AFC|nr:ATP phosphoribosyltransferase regulatory subunit [Prochlorococcus marinus]
MSIQSKFETKDLNPDEVKNNKQIIFRLSNLYKKWGYEEISPPTLERIETLIAGGKISQKEIVKLVADEPIGLRPEMTASIARAANTRFANKKRPLRFWSPGIVFKSKEDSEGRFTVEESLQSNIELIGIRDMSAEVELLYLLLESLESLEINPKHKPILLIGHKSLIELIIQNITSDYKSIVKTCLTNYDLITINKLDLKENIKNILLNVLKIRGNPFNILSQLEKIYGKKDIFEELKRLFSTIETIADKHGVSIKLDPTYQPHYDLYTGITFQLVCQTDYSPIVIARGGRYDDLFNMFNYSNNKETGAGFSFSIDNIRLLQKNKGNNNNNIKKRILIAYSTNRIYEDALFKQLELHKNGFQAMVELTPFKTKEEAQKLLIERDYDLLEWLP